MTKLLRILHLEDSPADAELVEHVLCKAGFDVTLLRVESHTDFVAGLESLQPDIILADYSLPTFDGMQALAIAREKYPLTPFIFVTGMMGEEASIQMLKNGASDYIIKDRLMRLPNAIRQVLEKQKEIARRISQSKTFWLQKRNSAPYSSHLPMRFCYRMTMVLSTATRPR